MKTMEQQDQHVKPKTMEIQPDTFDSGSKPGAAKSSRLSKVARLLFGEADLSRDLKLLLLIGGLFALSNALSHTFVNLYIWKQKSDYLTIALYNLATVIAQPMIFILAGRWAKQIDRIIVLRLGVFFLSVFYLVVLLLGGYASKFVLLLGALQGVGFGFYWLAFNVLTFEITEPDTRDIFNGFFGLLGSLAGMIGPILASWIITSMKNTKGYTFIFSLSLGLFIVAVILSFFLKRRKAEGRFELWSVINWKELSSSWKGIVMSSAVVGLREGPFLFLVSIWIFVAAGSEMGLGMYSLITSFVALLVYYFAGRLIRPGHRKRFVLLGAVVLSLAVWIIAFKVTYPKLLTYGVIVSIAYPLMMVPFLSMTYNVIGKAKKAAEWRIEYIVGKELFLNAGRIIGILLFIGVLSLFEIKDALPYFILVVGHSQLIVHFLIRNVDH